MEKLIIVFNIDDYADNGGGIEVEYPQNKEEMDKRCNELLTVGRHGCKCELLFVGEIKKQFEYEPIEKVVEYVRKEK